MGFDPCQPVPLGHSGLEVTRFGFGAASIGGLFTEVTEDDAIATIDHAWDLGVRYFDVAPLYGYGNAELRIGRALAGRPRDEFVVSTKVGRLLIPIDEIPLGAHVDRQDYAGQEDFFFHGTPPVRPVFDFSYDAIMRSVESSLERLRMDRIDILYLHDPDDYWELVISDSFPALERLREQGVVRAIGAGMTQVEMPARLARTVDVDALLVASRYTLLDQAALPDLMPLCAAQGIGVVIGGVMNSGILANPGPGARFDHVPAGDVWIDRALRLKAVCDRHDVPLKAAAVQFVLAHPAVASIVAGVRSPEHLDEYAVLMRHPIPAALWDDLLADGLLPAEAPTPGSPR